MHKLDDEPDFVQRGNIIVSKNSITNKILSVRIDDFPANDNFRHRIVNEITGFYY